MAIVLADRVQETTTTTGTGTISLAGASSGFQTFVAGVGNGNQTYYCIISGTNWEVGLGTVTSGTPNTLTRTTILASSNGGSAINLAGTSTVFADAPASFLSGLAKTPPAVVQAAASVGSNSTVVMSGAPVQGHILVAIGTHWNNGPTVNWSTLLNTNGAATDGVVAAYKVCGAGESATQTPFNTGTGGNSTLIFELSGVGGVPNLIGWFQESGASSLVLNSFNNAAGIVIGGFSVQGSSFDYSVSGATVDANVTGTTANNSPRRIKGFHATPGSTPVAVTATLDSGHNSAGVILYVPGG